MTGSIVEAYLRTIHNFDYFECVDDVGCLMRKIYSRISAGCYNQYGDPCLLEPLT